MTKMARISFGLLVLFGLVAITNPEYMPKAEAPYDKILHGGVFAFATLCGVFSTRNFKIALVIASLIVASGLAIEIVQVFLPGRSASFADAAANGVGSLVAVIFYYFFGSHRGSDVEDRLITSVMTAHREAQNKGSSSVECLKVAANIYRLAHPELPENSIRLDIIRWIEEDSLI